MDPPHASAPSSDSDIHCGSVAPPLHAEMKEIGEEYVGSEGIYGPIGGGSGKKLMYPPYLDQPMMKVTHAMG